MEVKALNWKHLNAWLGLFIWKTRPVSNKNRAWGLSPVRLLGKQSSSDSAVRVIAIPCIIELLAQPGPAHQGTVVCLCPSHHEAHSIMKKPLSEWAWRRRTPSLTFIQLRPSHSTAQVAYSRESTEPFVATACTGGNHLLRNILFSLTQSAVLKQPCRVVSSKVICHDYNNKANLYLFCRHVKQG